jgi:hypothetical protein
MYSIYMHLSSCIFEYLHVILLSLYLGKPIRNINCCLFSQVKNKQWHTWVYSWFWHHREQVRGYLFYNMYSDVRLVILGHFNVGWHWVILCWLTFNVGSFYLNKNTFGHFMPGHILRPVIYVDLFYSYVHSVDATRVEFGQSYLCPSAYSIYIT